MNNWFDIIFIELWINKGPSERIELRSNFADRSESGDDILQQRPTRRSSILSKIFDEKKKQLDYECSRIFVVLFKNSKNKFKLPDASEIVGIQLNCHVHYHLSTRDQNKCTYDGMHVARIQRAWTNTKCTAILLLFIVNEITNTKRNSSMHTKHWHGWYNDIRLCAA